MRVTRAARFSRALGSACGRAPGGRRALLRAQQPTRDGALAYCTDLGMDLASIENAAQNEEVIAAWTAAVRFSSWLWLGDRV